MNLALHGFLLQVFVSILNFQHGSFSCSAGEPGYLDFDNLPETNFSCQGKVIGGYYADVEAGCQMFHVCTIGQKDEIMDIKFLCLNGTVFDQETRVCERVDEVDCSKSERFYNLNLELYGNNAVTLSLHENTEDEDDPVDSVDDHQQRTTSARPTTTTTTTTTTSRPSKLSTTPSSAPFSHPTGYPQHYQPQPPFPQVHTSQSKSLYDDKNGGYHHQYIFHNGERNNNQATSYQLFSNQGVSSTTVQTPQVHQIRYSSTASPQIIHNEPSTVTPLFHTSSTIQTLLNSNANSPALINPIFHNHGIASTTEQFSIHNNNPRDTSEYRDSSEQIIRPLEAIQSTNKGKVSKLAISPVPTQPEPQRSVQTKTSQSSQQRIPSSFLPTPATIETTIRSFYPTPRSSPKLSQTSEPSNDQVATQHIHIPPPVAIPQLKPHQITINLPPPDIQRIVQNPSPLLPSQSRVIVTAKASVSDESGRPLNSSQLVTLPLPTIPASYDDYKEGDESFDPFYRDVPKIRSNRGASKNVIRPIRYKRSLGQSRRTSGPFVYDANDSGEHLRVLDINERPEDGFKSIKESLMKFRKILFSEEQDDLIGDLVEAKKTEKMLSNGKQDGLPLRDLSIGATRNLNSGKLDDTEYELDEEQVEGDLDESEKPSPDTRVTDGEEIGGGREDPRPKSRYTMEQVKVDPDEKESLEDNDAGIKEDRVTNLGNKRVLDVVILGTNEHTVTKSENITREESSTTTTVVPTISTTEETTQPTTEETTTVPQRILDVEPERKTSRRKEEKDQAKQRDANETERPEQKPSSKRISARIKSRGRMSRRKQHRNNSAERIPDNGRNETTHISLEETIGKIDSRIFKEIDPQTPKDVGTRAVDQRNRNAVKGSQDTKSRVASNSKDDVESKDYKIQEKGTKDYKVEEKGTKDYKVEEKGTKDDKVEDTIDHKTEDEDTKAVENHDKDSVESSTLTLHNEDTKSEKLSEVEEQVETTTMKLDEPGRQNNTHYAEEILIEHHEAVEDLETTIKKTSTDEEADSFRQTKKTSRRGKSMKFEESSSTEASTHRQDKSRKLDDVSDEDSTDSSTITSVESYKTSEETSEYFTESSFETSHEFSPEEDVPRSEEVSMTEEEHSEEVTSSEELTTEENEESSQSVEEVSTEGVLKFTDELPKTEDNEESTESMSVPESTESLAHDYVDDNYEPENYKEREDSAQSNELSYEKGSKGLSEVDSEEVKEDSSDISEDTTVTSEEFSEEDSLGSAEEYERTMEDSEEVIKEDSEEVIKEDSEEDIKEDSEEDTQEDSEEELPKIVTTSSTTTTTTRPTPPKLFKPVSIRKTYNYIPPTTTPNPVVIKPRLPLLNPKPAKPLKSYNDLVPKPVIRRLPLLTRKYTTTTGTTTTEDEVEEVETTTDVTSTTTEGGRSDENALESKLETKEREEEVHAPKNETSAEKDDQIPSPTQRESPTNLLTLNRVETSKKDVESFTPYPISRLSTMATTIGKKLEDAVPTVTESSTTAKAYTLVDMSVISTTSPTVTLAPKAPEVIESSTLQVVIEDTTSVAPPTSTAAHSPETTTEYSTTNTTTLETKIHLDDSKTLETTTVKLFQRKPLSSRRHNSFNCLEKEMYRFYGDTRDCRLFHYCSPGFTSRQVLDFRFVCEEGTAFDEESQSCRHDVRKEKCPHRSW